VVDSNDRERIEEASKEFKRTIDEPEMKNCAILVFANKQDLPNAMSVAEVTEKMELNNLRNRKWYIQSSCGTSGDGLYEGLDWLHSTLVSEKVEQSYGSSSSGWFSWNKTPSETTTPQLLGQ